jgi:hypothetical protein
VGEIYRNSLRESTNCRYELVLEITMRFEPSCRNTIPTWMLQSGDRFRPQWASAIEFVAGI